MIGTTIECLEIGQKASFTKTITETDVYMFAGISGDLNPAHLNEEYAKGTSFQKRIVHGMLSASLISAVIGLQMPGPGTIYAKQELSFVSPVYFGDTITATVEVLELNQERNRATLKTTCTNQNGKLVLTGAAIVLPPKAKTEVV